ncbi:uncharacterized protein LOC127749594 [Frankliniella occidentalis]|uniref:Uncharacterized protein LOC127749594 n=1 Tax=Frankliniella occidentalis TaxID=133901 RepID=A0A9C6TXV7_FRAOC|nr:uncharacterized protein LOC127749594 [Frankliniella occidentalis]
MIMESSSPDDSESERSCFSPGMEAAAGRSSVTGAGLSLETAAGQRSEERAALSPAAQAALQAAAAPSRGNVKKFKSNGGVAVVPPPDDFAGRKKREADARIDRSLKVMSSVAKQVGDFFATRNSSTKSFAIDDEDEEVNALLGVIKVSFKRRILVVHKKECIRAVENVLRRFEDMS